MHPIKYSQSNLHCDKVNSKSATRLFYRPFSNLFFFSKLDYLYFTAVNAILKNKLDLSLPRCLLQLLLNIHFQTCTQISHSQRFIGIGRIPGVDNVAHNLCCQIRADDNSLTCTFTTGKSVTCTDACANEIISNR